MTGREEERRRIIKKFCLPQLEHWIILKERTISISLLGMKRIRNWMLSMQRK
jgi:hypothetical protein